MTTKEIIDLLKLKPLTIEGGHYLETYRSPDIIDQSNLPGTYDGARNFSTAIYFLLTPDTFSEMHRLKSDEIFHFYLGDPVRFLLLHPDGKSEQITLGNNLIAGHWPQLVVSRLTWQGAKLINGGKFALMGTTVSPGFDFNDYESGERQKLISQCPSQIELITALTRK